MSTQNVKTQANPGTCYAFRLIRGGWLCAGMVADDRRGWWADYWMSNRDDSCGAAEGQFTARVAFVPFCYRGSNWLSQAAIDCEAVEVIGNLETSRS